MDPRYVVVASVNGHLEAEMYKAFLEAAGIQVLLSQETAGIAFGLTVGSLGKVDILVPIEEEEEAMLLISAMETGELEQPGDEGETQTNGQEPA